ncbi:hypothetical protein C8R43DRAFT_639598 [Mycena crocata]|nr:hypothetical protein C8R43DRAFT_639598 [Mycena crocata]
MLPQELIEAILEKVHDKPSLKACALTASGFRPPSQRKLFRSLVLDGTGPSWSKPPQNWLNRLQRWRSRLIVSPHLASYIDTLSVSIAHLLAPGPTPTAADLADFQEFLDQLINVRRCALRGNPNLNWADISTVVQPVLSFIQQQQNLWELQLVFLELPRPVFASLLASSATQLYLQLVDVTPDTQDPGSMHSASSPGKMKHLYIRDANATLDELVRPDFLPYTANLRKLGLIPRGKAKYDSLLVSSIKLDHIRFDYCQEGIIIVPLPPLDALRSIDILIDHRHQSRLIPVFSTLLTSTCSTLEEVTVSITSARLLPLNHEMLVGLDTIFSGRAALPRICWRVDFMFTDESAYNAFKTGVQIGLPSLVERGKLIFERYSYLEEERGEWAVRSTERLLRRTSSAW